jgi:hypothetical protein
VGVDGEEEGQSVSYETLKLMLDTRESESDQHGEVE